MGMIEGYVMVTANHLSQIPNNTGINSNSNSNTVEYNIARLVPGMVILQVNKQAVTTSSNVNSVSSSGSVSQRNVNKLVPQPVQDVFTLMNGANPIKLAVSCVLVLYTGSIVCYLYINLVCTTYIYN